MRMVSISRAVAGSGVHAARLVRWVKPLAGLGSLSYGVYVFHYPILRLIPVFAPSQPVLVSFCLGVAPLTIGLAYFFERKFKPWLNQWLKVTKESSPEPSEGFPDKAKWGEDNSSRLDQRFPRSL